MSGLVAVYRPETGAVGSQYFIPQYHVAVLIQSELELGICDNDSFGQCIIRTFFINSDGIVTKLGRIFCALAGETLLQIFHTLLIGDILIMISDLCLGGRGIDGLGKLICLLQTFRKLDTAYGTVLLVAFPAASGNVSTNDALDGEHVQLLAHHAVAVEFRLSEKFWHILNISRYHMIGNHILSHIKPEFRHLGQYSSFLCYCVVQDHIKAADTVSCHHDQGVSVVIDLTNFAFLDRFHFLYAHTISPRILMFFSLLLKQVWARYTHT